jgi:site-specific DNA-methyltransferase (adenine-specific)
MVEIMTEVLINHIDKATLYCGDSRDLLKALAPDSIDSIVTDPPYELGFMGKSWDASGIAYDVALWREALRVLKPGGHLLAFGGSRTYHRLACAIEDAGFEIRDQIMWLYGSGFPKSLNLEGKHKGWGTALKPAHEPVVMARKPLDGTVAVNVQQYGTGALNVDGCRIPIDLAIDDPRLGGNGTWSSDKMAKNVYEGGYAGERVGSSPLGRWPANVIHDGSDDVLAGFPHTKSGTGAVKKATGNGYAPNAYGKESREAGTPNIEYGDEGSAARFFYCAKASKADRDEGMEGFAERKTGMSNGAQLHGEGYDKGQDIGMNRVISRKNHHPTVKPTALMRHLCRLVTPPGGLVLDPFMGSGSTGKAARAEGFRFVGIEREPEYFAIASARVSPDQESPITIPMPESRQLVKPQAQPDLFSHNAA